MSCMFLPLAPATCGVRLQHDGKGFNPVLSDASSLAAMHEQNQKKSTQNLSQNLKPKTRKCHTAYFFFTTTSLSTCRTTNAVKM